MHSNSLPDSGDSQTRPLDDDQDIIQAQDIESGKDITDQTDIEREVDNQKIKENLTIKDCNKSIFELRKRYVKEGEINDNDEDDDKTSEQRIVVEKSPKGRFHRFNEELGSGAQKRVYRAFDYDNGREVAWNVINVNLMSNEAIGKIKEEIVIMKKLNHPNIISFISGFYNEEKKEVVIITEIFSGGSLKFHLSKYGIPRLRVIKVWCKEILNGLQYLHELENPVIHRDIKCDNIFINKTTGEVKIGDLGFSCVLKGNDYARTFSGTIEFCAPEVFLGKYGVRADIYSFGVSVLEMVTGERPYKECEGNILSVYEKTRIQCMPACLDKIRNIRLVDFIKSCLKLEPERPSARELLDSTFLNDLESEENNYPALMYPLVKPYIPNVMSSGNLSCVNDIHENHNCSYKNIGNLSANYRKNKDFISESHKSTYNFMPSTSKSKMNGIINNNLNNNIHATEKTQSGVNLGVINPNDQNNNSKQCKTDLTVKLPDKSKFSQCRLNNLENLESETPSNLKQKDLKKYNSNTTINSNINKNTDLITSSFTNSTNNHNSTNHMSTHTNENNIVLHNKDKISHNNIVNKNKHANSSSSSDDDYEDGLIHSKEKDDCTLDVNRHNNLHDNKDRIKMNNVKPFEMKSINKIGSLPLVKNSEDNKKDSLKSPRTPMVSMTSVNKSKIDIQITEEQKSGNIIKILLTKKDKCIQKVYRIKFTFNLKGDTCDGIVNELEKEIKLTEEEKRVIMQKLSNLVKKYTNTNIVSDHKSTDVQLTNEVKDNKLQSEVKDILGHFFEKYSKIMEEADEIIKASIGIKEKTLISLSNNEEYQEFLLKIKELEEIVKLK